MKLWSRIGQLKDNGYSILIAPFVFLFFHCAIVDTQGSRNWGNTTGSAKAGSGNSGTQNSTTPERDYSSHSATRVYGQFDSFSCNVSNNSGSCATTSANNRNLKNPTWVTPDSAGGVYIADLSNNRVLYFASGSTTATRVYGQFGSYTCANSNNGGACFPSGPPSANNLYGPASIAIDSSGGVYISDYSNNRVLYFLTGSTTATRVYGQYGSFSCNLANNNGACGNGSPSANNFYGPVGIYLDSSDGLYVADSQNHRVLYFPSGSTTASRVYGQSGSFTCGVRNNGGACSSMGISASNLNWPMSVSVDSSGGVYIADSQNYRVLYYASGQLSASRVYGTSGSFTVGWSGSLSADTLSAPTSAVSDNSGGLYIADNDNMRVLYFGSATTTPKKIYGQFGNYACNNLNNGGSCGGMSQVSSQGLWFPRAAFPDAGGGLYIADQNNHRVLYFAPGS
ncbi:MAG: NHL repeat-containing protein [Spirochaetes bacterium]|nr:NHL repeat-containing protein [Spirochaetota bacterium]